MTQQGFKLWPVDQESAVLTFRSQRVQESEKHGCIPLINGTTFNWVFVVYSITVYTVYLMSFYLFTKLRTESEGYLRLVEDWSYRVWNIHHSSSAAIHNKQETICCLWTLTSLFIYNLAQKVIPSSEDARDYTSFSQVTLNLILEKFALWIKYQAYLQYKVLKFLIGEKWRLVWYITRTLAFRQGTKKKN